MTVQFEGARYVTLRYAFRPAALYPFRKAKLAVSSGTTLAGIETTNWRKLQQLNLQTEVPMATHLPPRLYSAVRVLSGIT